ncbi:response regulator transcription factor [Anaerospora hongkongensis]|uniref:response regulator transcription factor n=1 Tax=Anaerospora hongkongensis TaxID=244830 RepID=UPI002FD9F2DD
MRILLVAADSRQGNLIKDSLEKAAIQVDWVISADLALEYACHISYDVIILKELQSVKSGKSVSERLLKRGYQGEILLLTADDTKNEIAGFAAGTDHTVVEFPFAGLPDKLRTLTKSGKARFADEILQIGNVIINCFTHCIRQGEREIQFTAREFQLLELLMRKPGRVVSRQEILAQVWGNAIASNNLDAYVRLLRKKLKGLENAVTIRTVRGIGYRLEIQDC